MSSTCDFNLNYHKNRKELFTKNGHKIFECDQCSHRFAEVSNPDDHISRVYSDSYFFEGKVGYPNYLKEEEILIASGKRYAELISKYTLPGILLDVGCAAGFITKGFEDAGWNCYGIEPNETMASYGRNEMHLNIQTGSLEEFKTNIEFDLVCLIEVLGHFYNLNQALTNIANLVKTGGFVLIESWNMKSLTAKIQGKKWHEYSPPSVLHWFSDSSLEKIFNEMGFQLLAKGHPKKRIKVNHAIALLDEHLPGFVLKKQIFNCTNKLAGKFTLIYPLDDLKWYIFKKQAIV